MELAQDLSAAQLDIDTWFQSSTSLLKAGHEAFMRALQDIEKVLTGEAPSSSVQALLQEVLAAKTPNGRCTLPCSVDRRDFAGGENRGIGHEDAFVSNFTRTAHGGAQQQQQQQPSHRGFQEDDDDPMMQEFKGGSGGAARSLDDKDAVWLVVQFKNRKLKYPANFSLELGEFVIVGGDRGEDIGMLVDVLDPRDPKAKHHKDGPGKALRQAQPDEVRMLDEQREAEETAIAWAQAATRKHMLDMVIVDAEYQFDRRKLTFYYDSPNRPDFRHLVRELYQRFRARIWMEKAKG